MNKREKCKLERIDRLFNDFYRIVLSYSFYDFKRDCTLFTGKRLVVFYRRRRMEMLDSLLCDFRLEVKDVSMRYGDVIELVRKQVVKMINFDVLGGCFVSKERDESCDIFHSFDSGGVGVIVSEQLMIDFKCKVLSYTFDDFSDDFEREGDCDDDDDDVYEFFWLIYKWRCIKMIDKLLDDFNLKMKGSVDWNDFERERTMGMMVEVVKREMVDGWFGSEGG